MTDDVAEVESKRAEGDQKQIEPAETFLANIGSIDDGNEATRQFNTIVNELRRDGISKIRVAIVEVADER